MEDLATLSLNEVTPPESPEHRLYVMAEPTALQQRAFELLDIDQGDLFPVQVQVDFTSTPVIIDQCAVLLNEVQLRRERSCSLSLIRYFLAIEFLPVFSAYSAGKKPASYRALRSRSTNTHQCPHMTSRTAYGAKAPCFTCFDVTAFGKKASNFFKSL